MITSCILGLIIGALLGITGAGGGILAVPALTLSLGWSMQQAAPVALIAIAGAAAVGAVEGFRKKWVRYRAALLMATAGIPCTSLGIYVAHLLSQQWLSRLFSIVMLLVAVRFLRTHPAHNTMHRTHTSARLYGRINPKTGKFNWNWPTAFLLGTMGSVTGFITGLLGVGGGFIIVPMLSHFTDAPLRSVIATSLLVIALTSSGSIVMTLAQGVSIPLAITLYFTGATALGMLIGRVIAQHIKVRTIQHGFGYLLILVAIGLFIKTIILIGPNL